MKWERQTMTNQDTEVRQGKVCWNCTYGRFPKRSTPGRLQGMCFVGAEETPPFPQTWSPSPVFVRMLKEGERLPDTFKEFVDSNLADVVFGTRYEVRINPEDQETYFAWMKWIETNPHRYVGFVSTCESWTKS